MAQAMLDQENFVTMRSQMLTQEQKDMQTLLNTFTENIESQQDQNFSQDDNVVPKKKKKEKRRKDYRNTKVKTKNLLTNVSYRRFKQPYFKKDNFIIDILSLLVQSFNLINVERKLDVERE